MFDLGSAIAQIIFIGVVFIIGGALFSFVKRKKESRQK